MKAKIKRFFTTSSVFITLFILISISTIYLAVAQVTSGNLYVYVELNNDFPTITWVNSSVSAYPLAANTRTIYVQFNATDANGLGDLNDASAQINLNLTGEQIRYNDSCTVTGGANTNMYTCAIDMQYYDINGDWTINASIQDNQGSYAENLTFTFTYNTLKSVAFSSSLLNFTNAAAGETIGAAENPLHIDNEGNQQITEINVTAFDLTKGVEILGASNFTVNASDGSGIGTFLSNNTMITVPNGNMSRDSNGGVDNNASLYFYVNVPSTGLTQGTFNSSDQWTVNVN